MKKMISLGLTSVLLTSPVFAKTVEERLEELELKSDSQAIKFGGRFVSRYDNFSYESRTTSTGNFSTEHYNLMRLQFSLNMEGDISSKLKFYGRYTTSKYFNHFQRNETLSTSATPTSTNPSYESNTGRDLGIGDNFDAGPITFLERAYFNYGITDKINFSLGRLPTIDGPPLNWHDNVSREGTYAHLAYSNTLDGMATTFNLSSYLPENHSFQLRLIYTPFTNIGSSDGLITKLGTGTSGAPTANEHKSKSELYTVMMEYAKRGSPIGEFLVLGQFLKANDLYYVRDTTLGMLRTDYLTSSLYTNLTNIYGSGFDFSASYFLSSVQNDSSLTSLGGLYAAAGDKNDMWGHAYLITAKYALPISFLNNPALGVEYINGDKHYFKADPSSHDLNGFYSTRGTGVHVYYTQPIETSFKLRVGYITKTDEYARNTSSLFGAVTDSKKRDNKVKNIYLNARLDF